MLQERRRHYSLVDPPPPFFLTKQSSPTCTLLSFITKITTIKCQFTVPMRMRLNSSSPSNLPHTFPYVFGLGGATSSTFRKRAWGDMRHGMNVAAKWLAFRTRNVPGSYLNQETRHPDWFVVTANTSTQIHHGQKATLLSLEGTCYMSKMTSNESTNITFRTLSGEITNGLVSTIQFINLNVILQHLS